MTKSVVTTCPALLAVYLIAFLQGLTLVSFPASSAVLKQMHGFHRRPVRRDLPAATGIGGAGRGSRRNPGPTLGLQPLLWLTAAGNGLSQLALAGASG
jgi:hypothetical protein